MSDVSPASVQKVVSPPASDASLVSPGSSHASTDSLEGFGDNLVTSSDDITQDKNKMSQMQGPERRRRNRICKNNLELICCVCGDTAFGYNFGVISCESCKAFFRRNATKNKAMECNFKGQCILDKHSRKFCTKCRLDKCNGVGMKREWILDDSQLAKRKKIENKKTRSSSKILKNKSPDQYQEMFDVKSDVALSCDDLDHMDQSLVDDVLVKDSTHNALAISTNDMLGMPPAENEPYISTQNGAVMFSHKLPENCSTAAISHEPLPIPSYTTPVMTTHNSSVPPNLGQGHNLHGLDDTDTLPGSDFSYQSLRHIEAAKILSLVSSVNTTNTSNSTTNTLPDENPDDVLIPLLEEDELLLNTLYHDYLTILNAPYSQQQVSKLTNKPQNSNQLFNMADGFIRRLIKFCKTIADFTTLTQEDQIALFKGGVMSVMLLRGAMELNKDKMSWQFNDDKGSTGVLPAHMMKQVTNATSSRNLVDFQNQISFFMSLHQVCRGDKLIMLMLFLIEMFSPDRQDLVDKDKVSHIQDKFSSLLSSYVYSIYPKNTARTIYPKLLTKLADLRSLADGVSKTASTLDISSLEPLLTEIFDL